MEEIRESILTEMVCPLKDNAKNLVFGKGSPEAEIMFIGEAPGEKEDEQGTPFVGAAGLDLIRLHVFNGIRTFGLTAQDKGTSRETPCQ